MSEKYKGVFKSWEIGVTKNVVSRQLMKHPILKRDGFEDLVSDCLIYWLENREQCDVKSKNNQKNFMAKVLKNYLGGVTRRAYATKRKLTYESQSLEAYFENENSDDPRKKYEPTVADNLDLKVEISTAFEFLTPDQKLIYQLIYEQGMSPRQASKFLKRHHNYVYRERDRIRQLFESRGLREYLRGYKKKFGKFRRQNTST